MLLLMMKQGEVGVDLTGLFKNYFKAFNAFIVGRRSLFFG
jgi:hypothetical protein